MNKSFKYVNERNKNEIRKWIRTQLLQENSIFVCPFLFFYFSHFLWWFGDFYKFFTHFPTVNSNSLCLMLILANHILAWKQKLGLPKSTWDTRSLHWQWKKSQNMYKSQNHHKNLLKGKNKKKHTEIDPFFQKLGSWSHCHLIFPSTVHIFNPIVNFSAIVCAFLRKT